MTMTPDPNELMPDELKASKLSDSLELLIKTLAADDRRWSTQETVEYNLRSLAQHILFTRASHPREEVQLVTEVTVEELLHSIDASYFGLTKAIEVIQSRYPHGLKIKSGGEV